jgi:uncharacterized protein (UPF0332 family)|nr:MAG: hypothetical protein [Bacteriophage sp.]
MSVIFYMKNLEIKSNENLDSFYMLKEKKKYNASVHCAYYAAYLLSLYSLCSKFGYTLENITSNTSGRDSHYYVKSELSNQVGKISRFDSIDFVKYINLLKKMRKKADYTNEMITSFEADFVEKNISNLVSLITLKYI